MKRELNLEQFYTKPEVASFCLSKLNISDFDFVIEPSAGDGSFSSQIKNCLAFDLEPKAPNIKKADFLLENFSYGKNLVIGNPPFGRQSSLAIKFINHSAKFATIIAFILPNSFKKESIISRLDKHLFLEKCFELPPKSFILNKKELEIPCSFFIFRNDKEKTRPKAEKFKTEEFSFCSKKEASFSIRRVGFYAGKVESNNVSESSHYFIKANDRVKEIFKNIKYEEANNTVGPKSISKNEIIKEYLCQKDKFTASHLKN